MNEEPAFMLSASSKRRLHVRAWEGEWIVFDESCGHTHLLNRLAVATLLLWQASHAEDAALAPAVLADLGIGADEAAMHAVLAAADQLRTAGLMGKAPP